MKSFVIIGLGRFGESLARELYSLGNEVLVIDNDAENIQRIANYVTHAVTADAKDDGVLRSLGVRNFDCAVVSIGSKLEDSVLITLTLKELGVKYVISKGHSEQHIKVLQKIGADKVIFPEYDMGIKLAQTISSANVIDYIELSDEFSIIEIIAPSDWVGKTLIELNVRAKYGINILAIRGEDENNITVSPSANYIIKQTDKLIAVGSNEDINEITSKD